MTAVETSLLLICALKEEARFLWNRSDPPMPVSESCRGLFAFQPIPGKTAHVLICGVGGKRAEPALITALNHIHPEKVLIAGWSGALSNRVNLFDLVQVDTVHFWESEPECGTHFDPDLSAACRDVLVNRSGFRASKTTVCSDIVVAKQDLKQKLQRKYAASLVDMESHYLLTILKDRGIPAAMIRVITDSADEQIGIDIENMPVRRAKKLAWLAARPKQAATYYRLIQDLKTASKRLEDVVPGLVRELS